MAVANARTLSVTGIAWPSPNNPNNPTVTVPDGSTGVVLNVTVTGSTAPSFVSILPAGTPLTSHASRVQPQLHHRSDGSEPRLCAARPGRRRPRRRDHIFNLQGNVQVIVDLEGYFTAPADRASGSRFFPVVPHRILDTRANIGGFSAPIGANQSISVPVTGQGGVLDGGTRRGDEHDRHRTDGAKCPHRVSLQLELAAHHVEPQLHRWPDGRQPGVRANRED